MKVRGAYMTVKDFLYTYQKGMIYTEKGNGAQDSWYLEEKRKLIIPDYQREYRWEEKQLIELTDDIGKGQCYLGQIAVARIANEPKNYYLVDGQQRITSIIILLTVLNRQFYMHNDTINIKRFELHKAENNNGDNLSRLLFETNCFDNFQFFLSQIYSLKDEQFLNRQFEHAINDAYLQEERYINACIVLHSEVKKRMELNTQISKKLDYVKDLISKVLETQVSVVIFEGDSSYESERVFLDINEKGLRLDNEDILKAYYFKTVSDENGKEALEIWQSLKEAYYKIKEILGIKKIPLETFVNYAFQTDLLMSDSSLDYNKFDSDLRYKDKNGKKHICELYYDTSLHNSMKLVVQFFQEIYNLLQNDFNSSFYRQYLYKRDSTTREIFKLLFNSICRSNMSIIFMALIKFWWLRKRIEQFITAEDIIQLFSFYIISNVSGIKKDRLLFDNNFISASTIEDTCQNLHIIEIKTLKDAFSKTTTLKRDQEKSEFLSFNIQMFYNDFYFNENKNCWEIGISNQEFLAKYSANREKYIKDHFLIQNGKEIKLFNGTKFQITQGMTLLRKRAYNFVYHKDNFDNIDFISRLNEIKKRQTDCQKNNAEYGEYENDYFSFIEQQLAVYFKIDNKLSSADAWNEIMNEYLKGLPDVFPNMVSYILEEHIYSWNNLVCKKFENQFPAKVKLLANDKSI